MAVDFCMRCRESGLISFMGVSIVVFCAACGRVISLYIDGLYLTWLVFSSWRVARLACAGVSPGNILGEKGVVPIGEALNKKSTTLLIPSLP